MLEVLVWSVLVGSLGIEATIAGGWLRWRQLIVGQQHQEEEETVTDYQNDRNGTTVQTTPVSFPSTGGKKDKSVLSEINGEDASPRGVGHPQSNGSDVGKSGNPQLGEWEYKIVRASFDLFRDPEVFQRLCEEEQQAGWMLLEKLDDRRVRFKRAIAWRKMLNTDALKFDPYRCHYGPTTGLVNFLGAIGAVTAMVLPAYLGYVLVANTLAMKAPQTTPIAPPAPVFEPSTPQPPTIP